MITTFRSASCFLALAFCASAGLWADEPPAQNQSGHVLVLDNERTLEGDIERVGDQYRIRRTVGETWVSGDKALHLCKDYQDAYAYLRGRANLLDPDERLRLANWCHLHGLREQALEEVTAAVVLRPEHEPSRRLLDSLQRAARAEAAAKAQPPEPEPSAPQEVPQLDLSTESLSLFATKVQPILMNTCASCHSSGRGGSFRLTRTYGSALANRKSTQQNLAAVLAQVNTEHPEISPLLIKAVSEHGGIIQPPIKGRKAPAFLTLEEWVRLTLADNPQLQEQAAKTAAPNAEVKPVADPGHESKTEVKLPAEPKPAISPAAPQGTAPEEATVRTPTKEPAAASSESQSPAGSARKDHPVPWFAQLPDNRKEQKPLPIPKKEPLPEVPPPSGPAAVIPSSAGREAQPSSDFASTRVPAAQPPGRTPEGQEPADAYDASSFNEHVQPMPASPSEPMPR